VTPFRNQAARLRQRYRADSRRPVQAYASAAGAKPGGTLEFRVSVPSRSSCSVTVRRFGTAMPTPPVQFIGEDQPPPKHSDGMTWCDWEPSLLLDIPESWPPGLYVARFSIEAPLLSAVALRGRSAHVPFVVRAHHAGDCLVVLPFAAYTARNAWPVDGTQLAPALSFDRPYSGDGLPVGFADDASFAERLAAVEPDADYATSVDLHSGAVDPRAYRRVLFRDDVWSAEMVEAIAKAASGGTEVALETVPVPSVRFRASPDGRPDRVLVRV
jgi:hypothetical protein